MERRWGCGKDIFGVRVTRTFRLVGCCSTVCCWSHPFTFFFWNLLCKICPLSWGRPCPGVTFSPNRWTDLCFMAFMTNLSKFVKQIYFFYLFFLKKEMAVVSLHYICIITGTLGCNPSYFNSLSQSNLRFSSLLMCCRYFSATYSVPVYLRRALPDPRAGRASSTVSSVSVSPSTRFSIDLLIDLNSSWDCTMPCNTHVL